MSVTITIHLICQDREATLNILSQALPITRTYKGCRYVNTFLQTDDSHKIILLQGWDSRAEQEAYIKWRQETGDLQVLVDTLSEPPKVEFWSLDAA